MMPRRTEVRRGHVITFNVLDIVNIVVSKDSRALEVVNGIPLAVANKTMAAI